MKLYVYCLAEKIDTLPNSLNGISGSKVRLLEAGDFSLLVSDFAGEAVPVTRDNALTHAAVVRSVLDQTTPLPFRFGTLVTEREIESYVIARHDTLAGKLKLVRDCIEMSVKIIWDRNWAEDQQEEPGEAAEKPGTAFLFEKRREILGTQVRTEQAKEVATWLQDRVGPVTRKTQTSLCPTEKLLLAASHLVERRSVQLYRTKLGEAREERPELHFLVSGPWPPYTFVNINLEFKSQFGVS